MSEPEETFCRLCAEPTPEEQLICCDDDVGLHSKITAKMLWINVDVSSTLLPKSICFSCFDLLERTWIFLHNVRTAQAKLYSIYSSKLNSQCKQTNNDGQPIDKDWEDYIDTKKEIKDEDSNEIQTIVPATLLNAVKDEPILSDSECSNTDLNNYASSDSDLPLKMSATKKRGRPKKLKRKKYDIETLSADLVSNSNAELIELDMSMYAMTWDDYTWCCANCDAQCKTLDLLRLHSIEIHNKCISFKCSDCNKVIANYKGFITHTKRHFKSLQYHCEICNEHFKMSTYVKRHRKTVHSDLFTNMCKNCGVSFDSEELLHDHMVLFAKAFRKSSKWKQVTDDRKCDICAKEFKSKSNMQAHRQTHIERTRDFSCHVCGKMFYTKGALGTHMATHEEAKPFKCEFCNMSFRARGNLTSHISLHSGAKPFVCEQCGKSFRVKRHLKSHSIVHTDLMPYICEYCNKSFRFKTRLNLHIRQHTGAKPYSCVYCRRDFTNGSNYKKHMKRGHNIDTSVRKKFNKVEAENSVDITDNIGRELR